MSGLKVCINARLSDGTAGGIQQIVIGLAIGFSQLAGGDEEYHFLAYPDSCQWLLPYLKGPCRPLFGPPRGSTRGLKSRAKGLLPGWLYRAVLYSPLMNFISARPAPSDGTAERAGMQVIHFPFQAAFLTGIPSLYQPHDLQHLHYPQYFSPYEYRGRELVYRTFCRQASISVMMSRFGKRDLVENYREPSSKVAVVPGGAVLNAYPHPTGDDLARFREKAGLAAEENFLYYPAQTWPHKNHLGLLEALALLRDQHGLKPKFLFSGLKNDFFPFIQKRARQLNLRDQLLFLGFVSPLEIQCLYRLCRGVVIPSRFEGWGLPLTEAFEAGAPVACSTAGTLAEQAGDGALLFDPEKPGEMADCMKRLWEDEALRRELKEKGRARAELFTCEKTARIFRALYRKLGGLDLSQEDRGLCEEALRDV